MREMSLYSILDRELIQQTQREVVVLQETRIMPSSDVRCHDVTRDGEEAAVLQCWHTAPSAVRRRGDQCMTEAGGTENWSGLHFPPPDPGPGMQVACGDWWRFCVCNLLSLHTSCGFPGHAALLPIQTYQL